jgi:DNA-binding NarL/FixJ family response regulator
MKRIFIVDDSNAIRQKLIGLLAESKQVRVIGQAGRAEEAIAAIRELQPDIVLLDIRLPGKSGLWLLTEIKNSWPRMAVVIMTNYDFPQYRRQSFDAGADDFFNKTLDFERMIHLLVSGPRPDAAPR